MKSAKLDQQLIQDMTDISPEVDAARIFDRIARSRRSVRGFRPTPVDPQVLEQIFTSAACAPSNCNTQPWYSHVVSGEMRDRLSRIFMQTIAEGKHSLDFPYEAKYDGIYRKRQVDVGLFRAHTNRR